MSQLDPTAQNIHTDTIRDAYDYVIVGAGMAATKAIEGIRAEDGTGSIGVFGADPAAPVYRPDLSKTLWLQPDADLTTSVLLDAAEGGAASQDTDGTPVTDIHIGTPVTALAPADHTVTVGDRTVGYGKLLLATGSTPRQAGLEPGDRVIYYRTVADYRRLREIAQPGAHVVVVGGGYIGSEIAAAMIQNDVQATLVAPEFPVLGTMFPASLAETVTREFISQGVKTVPGLLVGGSARPDGVTVQLEDGTELTADAVVVGVGVTPNSQLAESAGLQVDDGVVVDDHLRTSDPDVYAAGDVARFPDARLGERRVEHADAAESQGKLAGRNLAGADQAYDHTPFFWADLFDYGYEAIGEVDTRHATVEDWKTGDDGQPDHSTGVVYYLDDTGHVRGVLLWNVWDSVPKAQELIERTAETPVSDPQSLRGTIPLG